MLLSPMPSTSSRASAAISPRHPSVSLRTAPSPRIRADLDAWEAADRDPMGYDQTVDNARAHYARLVGIACLAGRLRDADLDDHLGRRRRRAGGRRDRLRRGRLHLDRLPVRGRAGSTLRSVPLEALAESLTDETWAVSFSLVQSANGKVADVDAVLEAAAAHDVLTFCDGTQGIGVHPFDASRFDVTGCHAYKWLCSPRGVGFMTLNERALELLTPIHANWYAGGDSRWTNIYGPAMNLATDARAFDVSPAWQASIGAEKAIELFAGLDIAEVWERTSSLGDALCDGLGIPQQHQAIVTWPDESGGDVQEARRQRHQGLGARRPAARIVPPLERRERRGCGAQDPALAPGRIPGWPRPIRSTRSSPWRSAVDSSTRRVRSTADRARRGTTAPSAQR